MSQADIFIEFLSHINQRRPELELDSPLVLALRFHDDLVDVLRPVLDAVWHQELRVVLMLEKYGATTCRRELVMLYLRQPGPGIRSSSCPQYRATVCNKSSSSSGGPSWYVERAEHDPGYLVAPVKETLHQRGGLDEVAPGAPVVVEEDMVAVALLDTKQRQCQQDLSGSHLVSGG